MEGSNQVMVLSDAVSDRLALHEILDLIHGSNQWLSDRHASPDHPLAQALARIELRVLYLDRHRRLSALDQDQYLDRARELRQRLRPGCA